MGLTLEMRDVRAESTKWSKRGLNRGRVVCWKSLISLREARLKFCSASRSLHTLQSTFWDLTMRIYASVYQALLCALLTALHTGESTNIIYQCLSRISMVAFHYLIIVDKLFRGTRVNHNHQFTTFNRLLFKSIVSLTHKNNV